MTYREEPKNYEQKWLHRRVELRDGRTGRITNISRRMEITGERGRMVTRAWVAIDGEGLDRFDAAELALLPEAEVS